MPCCTRSAFCIGGIGVSCLRGGVGGWGGGFPEIVRKDGGGRWGGLKRAPYPVESSTGGGGLNYAFHFVESSRFYL